MSNQRTQPSSPAILFALGIGFIVFALVLLAFQNAGDQGIAIGTGSGLWGRVSVAFITGLTTGGLSCLAVQGGLLASSLAGQIEQDALNQSVAPKRRGKKASTVEPVRSNTATPILLFLAAKLVTYTILGALLGWVGSFLALSPVTRAILMIGIGIFMLGNALRMLNVHPIFRYFSFEPPKFITRYIRRTSKGADTFTPVFLGALTVFIPCGITQAIMAAALATGSALAGASMLFAFTLGASPVFFLVAYLATELGARMEKLFMRFVAVVVLVLGLVTLDGGLNLMGSPYSFTNIVREIRVSDSTSAADPVSSGDPTVFVRNDGYFPRSLILAANTEVLLNLVTDKTYSCARDFVIPSLNYYQLLPDTGTVQVAIPPQPKGTRLFYTCSMGMYTGLILFE